MKLFKVHLTLIIYYFTGIAVKKSPPLSVRKDFSKDAAAVRPAIFTIEWNDKAQKSPTLIKYPSNATMTPETTAPITSRQFNLKIFDVYILII